MAERALISDTACCLCASVRRLSHTVTWEESMRLRGELGFMVVAGPDMEQRPAICLICKRETKPKTAKPIKARS